MQWVYRNHFTVAPRTWFPVDRGCCSAKRVPGAGTGWGKLCSTSAKHTASTGASHLLAPAVSAALSGSRKERGTVMRRRVDWKGPSISGCMFQCIPKERKLDFNLSSLIATALPPGGWMQTRRGCFSLVHFGKTALRSKLLDLCLHTSHLPRNEEWR